MSVENQILLGCARRDYDPEAVGGLIDGGPGVQRGVDWDALLAAARRHGLLPLLYEGLAEVGGDRIPADVMAHLRGAYGANLLRNRRLAAELAEVVDALRGEGIETIVLKGGALAPTVYDHPAQRPMVDLDLLLRPEGMERAGAVLASLGFRPSASAPAHQVPFQSRFTNGSEWQRSQEGRTTRLDVQHNLVKVSWCQAAYPVGAEAVWAAARPLALDGTLAWQLSAEDTLIHLCLHPALDHGYSCSFIGYADMDRVITAMDAPLSWSRLVERAERFGVKTVVYRGLRGVQRILGMPVPLEVLTALEPRGLQLRILRHLAPLDLGLILQGSARRVGGGKRVLLHAALVDDLWAAAGVLQSLLFPDEEWLATRYGLETRGQMRLYRLVHPLCVGWAGLQGLHRPLVGGRSAQPERVGGHAGAAVLREPTWSIDEYFHRG